MTPLFLDHYNTELHHIRQMAAEFARAYPKIAARLDLDPEGREVCPDPFVERLLEGFAFLAARTHLKLDAEFPRFTQSLLETVQPEYLCPLPSMAIVRFQPDLINKSLANGFTIPKGTTIRSRKGQDGSTPCTYRTAHSVELWPVALRDVAYLDRAMGSLALPATSSPAAALHLVLESSAQLPFAELRLDRLTFHLRGSESAPLSLMENLFAHIKSIYVRDGATPAAPWVELPDDCFQPVGFSDEESLIPTSAAGFQGYRLLREYFAFPQRFLFFEVSGLAAARVRSHSMEIAITLSRSNPVCAAQVSASSLGLYCTPAINLFEKRTDRVLVEPATSEHHVVVDRTRPIDYEVYQIKHVTGYGAPPEEEYAFHSFYRTRAESGKASAFYTMHRRPRVPTEKERTFGKLSDYSGAEAYVSLVDPNSAPYPSEIRQLGVTALCTNRHLPIRLSQSGRSVEFAFELNGPILGLECISGPTQPRASFAMGEVAWRTIGHLSLNYYSLTDANNETGASALRELLRLYVPLEDRAGTQQVDGLISVTHRTVMRRVPAPGMVAFARGLEITLLFDEDAFVGSGVFLLGMVLERFFAKHVSINSFTETVIVSKQRGELIRWPARAGRKALT